MAVKTIGGPKTCIVTTESGHLAVKEGLEGPKEAPEVLSGGKRGVGRWEREEQGPPVVEEGLEGSEEAPEVLSDGRRGAGRRERGKQVPATATAG